MNKRIDIISVFLIFFVALLSLCSCNEESLLSTKEQDYLSKNKDISVGVFLNYPPFEFADENGKIDGILIDYFNILEKKINHKFNKRYYNDWQKLINDAKMHKVDIVLEIQKTNQRLDYLTFTKPIFSGNHNIVHRKAEPYKSLKELKELKVAVCKDYAIEEYVSKNFPRVQLVSYPNENEALKALLSKKVEAFASLESSANYVITKQGYQNIVIGKKINYTNKLGIGINKKKPLLANIINKGNNAITIKEKDAIFNKWLYDLNTPIHYKALFWKKVIFIATVLLLVFFTSAFILKIKVKKKSIELKKAKYEAEKNDKLKSLFLRSITNEIKTPLNNISNYTHLIKSTQDKTQKKKHIDALTAESYNLTTTLNNIVEIADTITIKKQKTKYQTVSLNNLLDTICKTYSERASKKGLIFNYENLLLTEQNYIITDKLKLRKTIKNLLNNILKTTEQGHISLKVSCNDNLLEIQFKDTRTHKNTDRLKTIFNNNYNLEKELINSYDSANVGLTIANKNIRAIGGKIIPNINIQNGVGFIIKLPVKFSDTIQKNKISLVDKDLKILIAEDMKLNYLVLKKTLDRLIKQDKNIMWVKNGKEAVDLVKKTDFDIVFMDIKMPVLNGFDASKKIKDIKPSIVIIAQTAYTQERDIRKAQNIGFDGYITKPIDHNILKSTIKDLFEI